jgi:hypothetical protein
MNAGSDTQMPFMPAPVPVNNTPIPVDYSDAMLVQSNNSKTVAEAQIMAQEFTLQQSSLDREMQNAAQLEQSLANFDTKLQLSKLDYLQGMKAEADHHAEKLAQIAAQHVKLTSGGGNGTPDLPPPENA